MLLNASKLKQFSIAASDGSVGKVTDLLFDDASWIVRWLVVDTGNWLTGRKVLLPTSTLGHANAESREFSAKLTMQQVKDSPGVDSERPISRQMEANLYGHYGWSPYWGSGAYMGGYGYGVAMGGNTPFLTSGLVSEGKENDEARVLQDRDDPHLRSVAAVDGYHIQASDGEIGHVEDMLIEEADWSIHHLVIDTKNWWPGKKVLISPQFARAISWVDRSIGISLDRQTIQSSPAYDASTTVDRDYESRLNSHYHPV